MFTLESQGLKPPSKISADFPSSKKKMSEHYPKYTTVQQSIFVVF
jgi:hypothetical protein